MSPFEVDECRKQIDSLRDQIAQGGLSQRDYDTSCGKIAGIHWVIKQFHLRPKSPQVMEGATLRAASQEFAA